MTVEISGHTRLCGLMGDPVDHSRSPHLHNAAFEKAGLDYVYLAFRIPAEDIQRVPDTARLFNMRGFNLTMPHKMSIIPYLDHIDHAAELIGAVNTVVNDDGVLTGYSTDGYGFVRAFQDHDVSIQGKKMTLMGMGGAGTAIAVQAALDGLSELAVFSHKSGRSWNRVAEQVARFDAHIDSCKITLHDSEDLDDLKAELDSSDILGNATPLGMGDKEGLSPIPDASFLHEGLVVQDAIYAPAETELLRMAKEAGCLAFNGTEMLFYQGARAFEIWTGIEMPLTAKDM